MCFIDVDFFECGDYSLRVRGQPCSKVLSRGPCAQPKVNQITTRDRQCWRCIYVRSLETLVSINESILRWERKLATCFNLSIISSPRQSLSPEAIEEQEKSIEEMKAKVVKLQGTQKLPLLYTEGSDLTRHSQMLAILKYRAEEMRSVLLADKD